jgi:hypothetical protein
MILQTSPGHKFVYQQTLIILGAISDEFHKIRMVKLTKKINFSLQFDGDADVSVGQFQLGAKFTRSRKNVRLYSPITDHRPKNTRVNIATTIQ